MDQVLRLLQDLQDRIDQDQTLVQEFFQQLGQTIPMWLVPGLLKIVAAQAGYNALIITMNTACTVDPNGNGPLWS